MKKVILAAFFAFLFSQLAHAEDKNLVSQGGYSAVLKATADSRCQEYAVKAAVAEMEAGLASDSLYLLQSVRKLNPGQVEVKFDAAPTSDQAVWVVFVVGVEVTGQSVIESDGRRDISQLDCKVTSLTK